MFHWICPECGREIMPTMKECPACDGSQAEASSPSKLVAEAPKEAAESLKEVAAATHETTHEAVEETKEAAVAVAGPPPLPVAPVAETVAAEPVKAEPVKAEPAPDPFLAVAEQLRSLQSQNGKSENKAQESREAPANPEPPAASEPDLAAEALTPETIALEAAATARDLAALASINEPSVAPAPVHEEAAITESAAVLELVPVASGPAPAAESLAPEIKLLAPVASPALLAAPAVEALVSQEPVEAPVPEPAVEAQAEEAKPVEVEAVEVKAVEALPVEVTAVEAKTDAKPIEAETAEVKAEVMPVEAAAIPAPAAEAPLVEAPALEQPKVETPAKMETAGEAETEAKIETPAVEAPPVEELKVEPKPAFAEPKRMAEALENPKFSPRPPKTPPLPTAESVSNTATPVAPAEALNSALQYATPTFAVAPAQDHKTAILKRMKPAVSAQQVRGATGTPQLTLPGPTLPPQLNSVTEGISSNGKPANIPPPRAGAQTAAAAPAVAKTAQLAAGQEPAGKVRGWLVSLSVMTALLTAGGAAIYWALPPQTLAKVKPGKPEPSATPVETPASAAPATASNSLAKQIEVTGIRFVAPPNKKPEIHYLVVNHSPVVLNDVTVYVTLHTGGAKPGEPPLSRFSFRAPNVPAYESKEMTSTVEKIARELTFPEWQDVKAEISVGK